MRKKLLAILPIFGLTLLSACTSKSNDLMISEYIAGSDNNQVIEIYNKGDKEIDLSNYSIGIYSVKDEAGNPKTKIDLKGKIAAKGTYVVSNSKASKTITDKADSTFDNFSFGGKEGISLMYKKEDLDVIGNLGKRNDNTNIAYVRKTWRTDASTTFNSTKDYLYYNPDDAVKYLGEFKNPVTEADLLAGPKFLKEYLDKDFYEYTTSYFGTGGAIEVDLIQNIDGDTSIFAFPESAHVEKYMDNPSYNSSTKKYSGKVRYQEVDTPETQVQNNKVEEFGWPAKLNTAELQNKADHIYVQSNAKEAIVENYGRMLGFVFVTNGTNSTLVNFDTIKRGYSTANISFNGYICYKDCPYYNYFVEARAYAEENKLGLYGEKDPYWDYVNNKSKQL